MCLYFFSRMATEMKILACLEANNQGKSTFLFFNWVLYIYIMCVCISRVLEIKYENEICKCRLET